MRTRISLLSVMVFVVVSSWTALSSGQEGVCTPIPSTKQFTASLKGDILKNIAKISKLGTGGEVKYTSGELATATIQAIYTNLLESYLCRIADIRTEQQIKGDMNGFRKVIDGAFEDVSAAIIENDTKKDRNKALKESKANRMKELEDSCRQKELETMTEDEFKRFTKSIPKTNFIKERSFEVELKGVYDTANVRGEVSSKVLPGIPGNLFYAMNMLRDHLAIYYVKGKAAGSDMMVPILINIYSIGSQLVPLEAK